MTDYEALRPWASAHHRMLLDALKEHHTQRAVAEALGIDQRSVERSLAVLRQKAARQGYSPEHDMLKTAPDGFHMRGTSGYYRVRKNDKTGAYEHELRGQWVKNQIDQDHQIAKLLEALESATERFAGLAKPIPAPRDCADELLSIYPWGDPHVGMYAWGEETSDRDWDCNKAQLVHTNAMADLIDWSPPSKRAALILVGDNQHADNYQNQTARSKHSLDVDTRLPKVFEALAGTCVQSLEMMLYKHELVEGKIVRGNHDDVIAFLLAMYLKAYFRNEPRITIDTDPGVFKWIRHGSCLIGVTHGDTMKPQQMRDEMTVVRAKDWGETIFRHIYSGHLHHDILRELATVIVETLRTMAPADSYAAAHGFRSGSDMKCDVWHARFGRRKRFMVGPRE